MTMIDRSALVVGATGPTGRRVASRLWSQNVPVRCGSREALPPFDRLDTGTWAPALAGAGAVCISDPALAPAAIETLARLAVAAGAERLVLVCGRGEDAARGAEERFHAVAPAGTVLRHSRLAQEFSEGRLAEGVARGEVVLQARDAAAEAFVDADDVADVAVAALTEDRHRGRTYELTGPRLLHAADAIAEIAAVLGRPVRVTAAEPGAAAPGGGEPVCHGVDLALGRPARDFAAFARAANAAGAWAAPARTPA